MLARSLCLSRLGDDNLTNNVQPCDLFRRPCPNNTLMNNVYGATMTNLPTFLYTRVRLVSWLASSRSDDKLSMV